MGENSGAAMQFATQWSRLGVRKRFRRLRWPGTVPGSSSKVVLIATCVLVDAMAPLLQANDGFL